MSSKKHYPVLGTPGAAYPFPQAQNEKAQFWEQAMQDIGSRKKEVLFALYLATHEVMNHKRAQPRTALDMALRLSPADFLLQHEAHSLPDANDSGLENGLLLHSFLAEIRANKGTKHALIINPSITFCQALRGASVPATYHITCLFDELTASVYRLDASLKSFKVATFNSLNAERQYDNVLLFARDSSSEDIERQLRDLFPNWLHPDAGLHVVMPACELSGPEAKKFRDFLVKELGLRHILVVDPKATHVAPSKRIVLTFGGHGNNVSLQRACLVKEKSLQLGPNLSVSTDALIVNDKPIHKFCTALERKSSTSGDRNKVLPQYLISQHIALSYRTERQRGDKFRVVAYYLSKGTPSQQYKNESDRGERISEIYRSGSLSFDEEIDAYLDKLVMDEELGEIIRKDIRENVNSNTLDIPTLWYLCLPDLLKNEVYEHALCFNFIRSLSEDDGLFCLTLKDATKDSVHAALADYAAKHGLSGNKQHELIVQLRLIWNQACIKKMCAFNPFQQVLAERERKKHKRSELRESSTLRAIEGDSLQRLDEFLEERNDFALNALIWLKQNAGLPTSVIAALNWEDFTSVVFVKIHALMVSKHLHASGTTPVAFGALEQNRPLPLPEGDMAIIKYRRIERKVARAAGIKDKDFDKLPMFHRPGDLTRRLSKNEMNDMLKPAKNALGIEEKNVPIPHGDSVEMHDVNRYCGDLFRAFYDVRLRHTALFKDDMAFLYGTRLKSVACINYRDYWHPTTQLMLHQTQNRCANLQRGGEEVSATQHPLRVDPTNGQPLVIPASSVRTQTVVTIAIPANSNLSTLCAHIKCRFGMDVTISYHPNI